MTWTKFFRKKILRQKNNEEDALFFEKLVFEIGQNFIQIKKII